MRFFFAIAFLFIVQTVFSQADTTTQIPVNSYKKPGNFTFLTNIPLHTAGYIQQSFRKENLYKICIVGGATALLYMLDPSISGALQSFSRRNNISAIQDYDPVIQFNTGKKKTNIGKLPRNFNTAIYNLGQGSTVIFITAGLFLKGKFSHDNRALNTANQLLESFIALGAGTQFIKFSTGRETNSDASSARGRWRPFPSFNEFQNNKSRYDAFPSGHLATLVSAITILSENYSEIKWIKPVGYSIAALCSLAMINNGVHWASDYPLGAAIGYGYGKYIAGKNKKHLLQQVPEF